MSQTIDFHLHKRQGEALLSQANEILYGGAAGGGKSHLMRVLSILLCASIPNINIYLFRRKYKDLTLNHLEGQTGYRALLDPFGKQVSINESKLEIKWSNGAKIHLCHCQHEKDMYNYQGAEIHVLMIDELTHFTEKIYTFLRGRVRLGSLTITEEIREQFGEFPKILNGSNPGNIGHTWVKQTFVDYGLPMEINRVDKKDGGMLRQYIPAKLEDNPTLLENDPDYEDRLEGLGNEALVKAMREGDWDIVAGGMFDDVWDRKVHVLPSVKIKKGMTIYRSFDWGSSHPFSVGWTLECNGEDIELQDGRIICPPRGSQIRVKEYYGWNGRANEGIRMSPAAIAHKMIELEKVHFGDVVVQAGPADTAIWSDTMGKNTTIIGAMEAAVKMYGRLFIKAIKDPGSRVAGWQRMRDMLLSAINNDSTPHLYVTSDCPNFIRTIPVLPRDEKNPDDIDTNAEDHIADEARYMATIKRITFTTSHR